MDQGLIRISKPKTYTKSDCVHILKGQKKTICILKGKFIDLKNKHVLCTGDTISKTIDTEDYILEALEDSAIIMVESQYETKALENRRILDKIILSTVNYINELNERLLNETPSIRP